MVCVTDARSTAELTAATGAGLRWIALARVGTELLLLVAMVALARLLPPSAFGAFAIVLIVQELAVNVPSEGVSSAIVQRSSISRRHLEGGMAMSLLIGAGLAAATLVLGVTLVPAVFGAASVALVLMALPCFAFGAVLALPMAVLRRRLDFRRLALLGLCQSGVRAGASILLATAAGLDAAALVLGGVAGMAAITALAVAFAPVPMPRWRRREMRELADYGGPAALASFSWVGFRNSDYAIVGAVLGTAQAGLYWRGFQLAVEYQMKISSVMAQVGFPVLSRTSGTDALYDLRHRMARLLTVVVFPLLLLLVVVAPVLIPWAFGSGWEGAVMPTQVLAAAGAATVAIDAVGATLMATGRTRALLGYGYAHFGVYALAILAVAPAGLAAVSVTAAAVHVAFLLVAYAVLARGRDEGPLRLLARDLGPAVGACAAMAAPVLPLAALLGDSDVPAAVRMGLVAGVGGLVYLAALRVIAPPAFRDVVALVRRLLPSRLALRRGRRAVVPAQPAS
jgi:O-antigen/teichoic acid export membrane protein